MKKTLEIVDKIELLLEELKASLGATSPKTSTNKVVGTSKPETTFNGLTGEIYSLVKEGFFKEPKTISEIQNKLRLEGIKKPTTSLSGPLLFLTKKKILGRSEPADGKGSFKYYQR